MQENKIKLPRIDYSDLYFDSFRSGISYTKEDFLDAFFTEMPEWLMKIMIIKNERQKKPVIKGGKYLFFDIIEINDIEIILGGSESNLAFRFSIAFTNNIDDSYIAVISTKVYLKNIYGKIYFFFVKPFHKMIIKKLFNRTINSFKKDTE
jgi:hypothetical protein